MAPPVHHPSWYDVEEVEYVPTPALLIYRERLEENLRRMIMLAGGVDRLRPHIKTHKMPALIKLQLALGITKYKCATLAEAEMAASCGVPDLLLAYPPVGPNVRRFVELRRSFPQTKFSVIGDDAEALNALSAAVCEARVGPRDQPSTAIRVEVLLDIDCGQHRTGLPAGASAMGLYRLISALPGLSPGGLHAYDGHICDTNLTARTVAYETAFTPVAALRQALLNLSLAVPRTVAGGTPTFPFHARCPDVECSPGTCVFWDAGYAAKLPDLPFLPAALVLTRVVSKPGSDRLCLDLGHKAIASEMPHPRVQFLNLAEAKAVAHSEEHLVIETARAGEFQVGDCLFGLPWHICPTVALYAEGQVVENRRIVDDWKITARERRITI